MPVSIGQMKTLPQGRRSDMFKVWNRDIKQILQPSSDAKELDNVLRLIAEALIEPERLSIIHLRHFE